MSIREELDEAIGRQTRRLAEDMGETMMKPFTIKAEFPRRQAMLRVVRDYGGVATSSKLVPVLVWPMPTFEGDFIVEHHDGSCTYENARDLTFLDSDELFDQYVWE